jgi:hypothetical protein
MFLFLTELTDMELDLDDTSKDATHVSYRVIKTYMLNTFLF